MRLNLKKKGDICVENLKGMINLSDLHILDLYLMRDVYLRRDFRNCAKLIGVFAKIIFKKILPWMDLPEPKKLYKVTTRDSYATNTTYLFNSNIKHDSSYYFLYNTFST